ncbi:MAG: nucleoside-diphosphate sugar epimerase/dehydratase, partial [Actinomycetota bacterium]
MNSLNRAVMRRHFRPLIHICIDGLAWALAIPLATYFRFNFADTIDWSVAGWTALATVLAQVVLGLGLGLYRRRLRYGESEELMRLAVIVLVIAVSLGMAIRSPFGDDIRSSVPSLGPAFASLVIVGSRVVWRLMVRRQRESDEPKIPILIVGAGDAGYSAVRLMLDDRRSPYRPVGLVDDDPLKSNLRIMGVPVLGTISELSQVARQSKTGVALLAIPSADIDQTHQVDV